MFKVNTRENLKFIPEEYQKTTKIEAMESDIVIPAKNLHFLVNSTCRDTVKFPIFIDLNSVEDEFKVLLKYKKCFYFRQISQIHQILRLKLKKHANHYHFHENILIDLHLSFHENNVLKDSFRSYAEIARASLSDLEETALDKEAARKIFSYFHDK